ncbi:MAG: hypothetical protein M1358_00245, partial [Chloroflexi bacterium]|nr:hypothetical protein [Chloroflexota bacterium]
MALALGFALSVQLLNLTGIDMRLLLTSPGVDCVHDPARLSPVPNGPEGRPANYLHTCGNRLYDSQGREV